MYSLCYKIRKIVTLLMVCVMVCHPILVLAADANNIADTAIYHVDKTVVVQDGSEVGVEQATDKERKIKFGNKLLGNYIKDGQRNGPEWFKRTNFEINFSENNSPVYSLETVWPLGHLTENGQQWFSQGRYAREGASNSTGNIGFGWRKLAKDKSSLMGLNLFYDYGFQYNLERVGVGAEYFNKLAEYRANFYYPLSNDRLIGTNYENNGILYSYIRAVEGVDFEAGTSFEHAPWLKVFASGYIWDNKYKDTEVGYRIRSMMQLTPRINMEVGYTHSNLSQSLYGNMKYQLTFGETQNLQQDNKKKQASHDLSKKLLQKIERKNDIKTETYTKFVAYTGSIQVTAKGSNNVVIPGTTVQAYQNGVAIGSTATTNESGIAILSGLGIGSYTVHASWNGQYPGQSAVVEIKQKDDREETIVELPVSLGSADITVKDNSGTLVSGATVTANYVSASVTVTSLATKIINNIFGIKTAYAATSSAITATTNASGVATFKNLPQGTYTFTVTYDGYSMTSEEVVVASATKSADLIVVPTSGGDVRGVVKNASGTALNGATVSVLSGTTTVATGTTDANGVVLIGGIAAGTYTVMASLTNYESKSVSVTVAKGATVSQSFALSSAVGTVTISVKDTNGNAISGASVKTTVGGVAVTADASTGTATVTVPAIVTGTPYVFTASASGYTDVSETITVTPSGASGSITLSGAGGAVSIAVTDTNGHAISGSSVKTTVNGIVVTADASNGTAVFTKLPAIAAGTSYIFTAGATGYADIGVAITVTPSGTTGSIILPSAGSTVTITVKDANGNAISGASVKTTVNGVTVTADASTSTAVFTNIPSVAAGTSYTFTASGIGYTDTSVTVTVKPSGASGSIILPGAGGVVTIAVKDANGNAISGASVQTMVNGTAVTVSASSGTATFTNLPAGIGGTSYTFIASASGYTDTSVTTTVMSSGTSGSITLPGAGSAVAITVQDTYGKAISGSSVKTTVNGMAVTADASTGTATFTNLPAIIVGTSYIFTASASGYADTSTTILATPSGGSGSIILPVAGGTVSIAVTDAYGKAISGASVVTTVNGTTVTVDASTGTASFTTLPSVVTGTPYTFTASATCYTSTSVIISATPSGGSGSIVLPGTSGTATITVKDTSASANTISEATVSVLVNGTTVTAITNSSGVATFTKLPAIAAGTYYAFTATKTGYTQQGIMYLWMQAGRSTSGTIKVVDSTTTFAGSVHITSVSGAAWTVSAVTSSTGLITSTSLSGSDLMINSKYTGDSDDISFTISSGGQSYDVVLHIIKSYGGIDSADISNYMYDDLMPDFPSATQMVIPLP